MRPARVKVTERKLEHEIARIRRDGGVIVNTIHRDRGQRREMLYTIEFIPRETLVQGKVRRDSRRPQRRYRRK